ncbi:hypothetical protein BKA61DRAFT_617822 [Leptodontidium sp. MPI-SDFR-AT-0119]|nr:hypothetical protein BKA61DRAFT_617822 [Leptodontidium sp. MPI-SDFR-AT-0119]
MFISWNFASSATLICASSCVSGSVLDLLEEPSSESSLLWLVASRLGSEVRARFANLSRVARLSKTDLRFLRTTRIFCLRHLTLQGDSGSLSRRFGAMAPDCWACKYTC